VAAGAGSAGRAVDGLAAVDGRDVAGADQDTPAASTASWLRNRLHLSHSAAHTHLRTARGLFRGPLTATAQAVTAGELSPAHAAVLAAGTHDLPHHTAAEAEPALLDAARRLDPPDYDGSSPTGALPSTPRPLTAKASANTPSGGCGCWPPWTRWLDRPTPKMSGVAPTPR
jgi:hypothetical protein